MIRLHPTEDCLQQRTSYPLTTELEARLVKLAPSTEVEVEGDEVHCWDKVRVEWQRADRPPDGWVLPKHGYAHHDRSQWVSIDGFEIRVTLLWSPGGTGYCDPFYTGDHAFWIAVFKDGHRLTSDVIPMSYDKEKEAHRAALQTFLHLRGLTSAPA